MRQIKLLVLDLILIALATFIALLLRENLEVPATRLQALIPYLVYTLVCAAVILPVSGITSTLWRFGGMADYWRLVIACAMIVLSAVTATFAFSRMDSVARSIPILQFLLIVAFLLGMRGAMRAHRFRRGRPTAAIDPQAGQETVLVVGLNSVAELFLQAAVEHALGRIGVAGVLGRTDRQTGQSFRTFPILGVPEDIASVLKELEVRGVFVDRIVVAIAYDQLSPAAREALADVENGSQIKVDFFAERVGFAERPPAGPARSAQSKGEDVSEMAALIGNDRAGMHVALRRPYWKVKRAIDVVLGSAAIILALPVILVIGVLVVTLHGMPMLFWQQRPGRNGRPFKVYKFRSLLGALDENGRRLTDAERSTRFGQLLRMSRLDEIPQLFNIVRGHMSIVGPRPLLNVDQIEAFRDRLLVRPGLTGWAQVNGGKSISASDKMALDLWYIQHASFRLDCRIIVKTIEMVLRGERQNPDAVQQAWTALRKGAAARTASMGSDSQGLAA